MDGGPGHSGVPHRHVRHAAGHADARLGRRTRRGLDRIFSGHAVVLWGARPFFVCAWQSVVSRNLNMFTLFGLGIGVAYGYSVVALFFPAIFPPTFRGEGGVVAVYFEAAAVIVVLVLLGQVLELGARSQSNAAIRALLHLAPKTAHRVAADGSESDVPLDAVVVGRPAAGAARRESAHRRRRTRRHGFSR